MTFYKKSFSRFALLPFPVISCSLYSKVVKLLQAVNSRILLYFLAGIWLFGPTLYRPAADFVGAGGGFSSLVVRSFQLFHPLVGKQLSSAICQSANRGQIRGLLSWCCCYCCSPSGSKFNEHKTPSSIYSCSIGHFLEYVFCHLGCWAVKFLKRPNFC